MTNDYEIKLVAGLDQLKSEQDLQKIIPKIIEKAEKQFREKGIELSVEIKETMANAIVSKFTKDLKTGFQTAKINIGDYITYSAKDSKKGIIESVTINSEKFIKDQQRAKESAEKEYSAFLISEQRKREALEKAHHDAINMDKSRTLSQSKELQREYTGWWTNELNKRESVEKAQVQAKEVDTSKTKKNIAEQEKYNQTINRTNAEFEQLKIKADGAQERVSRTASKESITKMKNLREEVNKLEQEFQQLTSAGKVSESQLSTYNNEMKTLSTRISQAERNANKGGNAFLNFGEKLKIAAVSFALWQVVTETFYRVKQSFAEGMQAVVDLDTAMVDLIKVTNETNSVYENFEEQSFAVADSIATTAQEVIKATTGFARMGYTINESSNLGKFAIILKNVGDEIDTVDEATGSLIATMKGFNMEAGDAERIVDAVNEVSNNFAVTTGDLTSGIERVSAVMSQSGVSFEQTLGLITGATEIMQNAAKASTGLRTLSERLRGNLKNSPCV